MLACLSLYLPELSLSASLSLCLPLRMRCQSYATLEGSNHTRRTGDTRTWQANSKAATGPDEQHVKSSKNSNSISVQLAGAFTGDGSSSSSSGSSKGSSSICSSRTHTAAKNKQQQQQQQQAQQLLQQQPEV
ncbi:hypothetical protein Emag_006947 [Eimeria magna]